MSMLDQPLWGIFWCPVRGQMPPIPNVRANTKSEARAVFKRRLGPLPAGVRIRKINEVQHVESWQLHAVRGASGG